MGRAFTLGLFCILALVPFGISAPIDGALSKTLAEEKSLEPKQTWESPKMMFRGGERACVLANSTSGGLKTLTFGIANFKVTINGTTYTDTAFSNANWATLALYQDNFGAASATKGTTVNIAAAP